ncbi:lipase family protein [Endozoicomonas arenosclerae]|uniref:lipase family protein n=1 Tax=Endozoicomonas arenosclerae TaxID=1633495 RepID=UPI000A90157D|nr:lipase family protein [Endozoicomonas arenosclerae]
MLSSFFPVPVIQVASDYATAAVSMVKSCKWTFILAVLSLFNFESVDARDIQIEDYVWLARAASVASYQPLNIDSEEGSYLREGRIQENWSSTRVSFPGRCAHGLKKNAALCYESCPDDYKLVGPVCWKKCRPGYKDDGALCRKDTKVYAKKSYGRGAGEPFGCRENEERHGLLCYPSCKEGYYGVGPVCWQSCPDTHHDHGATCYRKKGFLSFFFKKTHGRGAGRTLTSQCRNGLEKSGLLCYPGCKHGYSGAGPVCYEHCREGYTDTGATCHSEGRIYGKETKPNGVGKPLLFHSYESVFDDHACDMQGWRGYSYENDQAYILLTHDTEKVAVFAFRGTRFTNLKDWFGNIDFTPHAITINDRSVWLHSGFWRRFNNLSSDLKGQLMAIPEDYTVLLVGHSLGAAVATIAATFFHEWGRTPDAVITFASPLVGNNPFKEMYQATVGCNKTLRVTVKGDPITGIPKSYGFKHVCDDQQHQYSSSNPLKQHDMFLGYHKAIEELFGYKDSAAHKSCTVSAGL